MSELDEQITQALEAVPQASVPEDFAVRLMLRVPARRERMSGFVPAGSTVGRRVSLAALAVLAALMLALAPWAWGAGHAALTAVEWLLCAEFVGLTLWMSPVARMRR